MDNLANVKPFVDSCFFAPPTIAESDIRIQKLQAIVLLNDNAVDLIDDHYGLYLVKHLVPFFPVDAGAMRRFRFNKGTDALWE